ncbi:hypothetical protein Tco_1353938 [Tanacetum coccineum]
MQKGCTVFLAHVTTNEVEDKSEKKRLEDVPIVRDFPEVFPEDLPDRQTDDQAHSRRRVKFSGVKNKKQLFTTVKAKLCSAPTWPYLKRSKDFYRSTAMLSKKSSSSVSLSGDLAALPIWEPSARAMPDVNRKPFPMDGFHFDDKLQLDEVQMELQESSWSYTWERGRQYKEKYLTPLHKTTPSSVLASSSLEDKARLMRKS